jgi:predicted transcriptional regulator of viral defense system
LQYITLMKVKVVNIENWIDEKLAVGRYSFRLSELKDFYPDRSDNALKLALNRQKEKGKVLSVSRGFYIIIPPQYSKMGILPVTLFIDPLMDFLNRKYYVSLLSAASFFGSSHQQPQEFFVNALQPTLRPIAKNDLKINFISLKEMPQDLIVKLKTESGYVNVSNPALTAVDLINFSNRIGGLNRAATVINDLSDELKQSDFTKYLLHHAPVSSLQKLGYILEFICGKNKLADALFSAMKRDSLKLFRIKLSPSGKVKGFSSLNRWKVIVNTEIEIDE